MSGTDPTELPKCHLSLWGTLECVLRAGVHWGGLLFLLELLGLSPRVKERGEKTQIPRDI